MGKMLKPSLLAILMASASGLPIGMLPAQEAAPLAVATPAAIRRPVIAEIEYRFEGPRPVDTGAVAAHVQLEKGKPYLLPEAEASIQALYRTGLYTFVSIEPELLPDRTVKAVVYLVPRLRVQAILFEGNKEWDAHSFFSGGLMKEV